MNILMMTNTYTPIVGGLERSVRDFSEEYRRRGHRVLIVAPEFDGMPERERDVLRIPAIQKFNGSDFSVKLPVPRILTKALMEFQPDLIHAHHPFLIGNTALRLAHTRELPLVFTHHTLFEQYTHYLPIDTPAIERFVVELSTGYANLCDQVFAPSHSVAKLLEERDVTTPIAVVPTGVDVQRFASGRRVEGRTALRIGRNALVVGHVGRLAPEKNLGFLARAMARFLTSEPAARCLVVGQGPSEDEIRQVFAEAGVADRLVMPGVLKGQDLIDAYHAMDLFAFASQSETQGLVVAEAMAVGIPVVAVDAPGVRDVVRNGWNGRLLPSEILEEFVTALRWVAHLKPARYRALVKAARATAEELSMERCADLALGLYRSLLAKNLVERRLVEENPWTRALHRMRAEWEVLKTVTKATTAAMATRTQSEPVLPARQARQLHVPQERIRILRGLPVVRSRCITRQR